MKKLKLLLATTLIVLSTSIITGQEINTVETNKSANTVNPNLIKGKSQIAIDGLSFGFGYGRVIGSIGMRYGYFVANNNLLFINGEFSTYGNDYQRYKLGLNYRRYFNLKKITPYAQIGFGGGIENFYVNKNDWFGEVTLGGGVAFQVKKFGFELGMQLDIWDKVNFKPTFGVSYTF